MVEVLNTIIESIGNIFNELAANINGVIGNFGNLSSEVVGGDDTNA